MQQPTQRHSRDCPTSPHIGGIWILASYNNELFVFFIMKVIISSIHFIIFLMKIKLWKIESDGC